MRARGRMQNRIGGANQSALLFLAGHAAGNWNTASPSHQQDAYYGYHPPDDVASDLGLAGGAGMAGVGASRLSQSGHHGGGGGSSQGHGSYQQHDYQSPARHGGPGGPGAGAAAGAGVDRWYNSGQQQQHQPAQTIAEKDDDPYGGIQDDDPSPYAAGHARTPSGGPARSQYAPSALPPSFRAAQNAPGLHDQQGGIPYHRAPNPASQIPMHAASPAPSHMSIPALGAWTSAGQGGPGGNAVDEPDRRGPLRVVNSFDENHY